MLKNGKTGNRNGQQNLKTEVFSAKTDKPTEKMAKTENPNAPLNRG